MREELIARTKDHFGELKEGQAFDPTIILVIAEIIIELITQLQESCAEEDPVGALKIVKTPTRLGRFVLNRQVRRNLGYREFRQNGRDVAKALLRTGSEMTLADMEGVYN